QLSYGCSLNVPIEFTIRGQRLSRLSTGLQSWLQSLRWRCALLLRQRSQVRILSGVHWGWGGSGWVVAVAVVCRVSIVSKRGCESLATVKLKRAERFSMQIDNTLVLMDWRRIHTRYDRCAHTFMSAICIAAAVIFWL